MKRIIMTLPLLILCSCKIFSPESRPELIAFVSARAGEAAQIAVAADIEQNPGHRDAFVTGVAALNGLLQLPEYSSADLRACLLALPIKEFKGSQGALVLTGTMLVYDLITMTAYDISTAPALQSIALAVRDGIQRALDSTPETTLSRVLGAPKTATEVLRTQTKTQLVPRRTKRI